MEANQANHTQNDSFSCNNPSVLGYRYFAVLWGCTVMAGGTVGNLMTVLAFALDPRLRTRFNVLIVNLAAADLLYCTLLQPFSVDSYLHLRWRGGPLWCRAFGLLLFLSNSVSIITLCLLAASRYLLVAKRAVFDRVFSDRGLALLLVSAWGMALASFAPLHSVFTFVPEVCTCSFHRVDSQPYSTVLLFLYFFVGLGCVGTFYFLIYRRVRAASEALRRYRVNRRSSGGRAPSPVGSELGSGTVNTCVCEMSSQGGLETMSEASITKTAEISRPRPSDAVSTHAPAAAPRSSGDAAEIKRVTRMCFTVFLCFVSCFAPFLLLNIVDKGRAAPRVLHMFCANLTWLNSCINPVLYAIMNRQFRQAYGALLARLAAPFSRLCRGPTKRSWNPQA